MGVAGDVVINQGTRERAVEFLQVPVWERCPLASFRRVEGMRGLKGRKERGELGDPRFLFTADWQSSRHFP